MTDARGVVYTPRWVAERLVEGSVGRRLDELRAALDADAFRERLRSFTVLDPACGDGALLRAAADRLAVEARRVGLDPADLLPNLHGADRDPQAVEAARTAIGGGSLRVGEALLGLEWSQRFDAVVMNPPWVKLQTLRRHEPAFADALRASPYASAQTGNVDLYLPFIELGVGRLQEGGRMACIAPSSWLSNQHGRGLRAWIGERGALTHWQDLGDQQVFAGASTYSALQFFAARGDGVVAVERDGEAGRVDVRPMGQGPWVLRSHRQSEHLERVRAHSVPLEQACERIFVGVQTSADAIYHLERLGPGRYRDRGGQEHALEDAVMAPLVSGRDTRRYVLASPSRRLLLPYRGAELRTADALEREAPKAWAYLRGHEAALRRREGGRMDRDDRWWGFNYPKNLRRQGLPKLMVAQTVPGMRVFADVRGALWGNNVRVNALQADSVDTLWFLLGVLNSAPVDRVFRWTARPKKGGWFEANKQFLAPLPVPLSPPDERAEIGRLAQRAQEAATGGRADANAEQRIDRLVALRLGWTPGEIEGLPARDRS
mgnify:CR=1 FL=1